jgi:hypothetical protein
MRVLDVDPVATPFDGVRDERHFVRDALAYFLIGQHAFQVFRIVSRCD